MTKITFTIDTESIKGADNVDINTLKEGRNKIVECEEGLTLWATLKNSKIVTWNVTDKDNKPLDTIFYLPPQGAADAGTATTTTDGGTGGGRTCAYVCSARSDGGTSCWLVCS